MSEKQPAVSTPETADAFNDWYSETWRGESGRLFTRGELRGAFYAGFRALSETKGWQGDLLLRWCEWTGGHLSTETFVNEVHKLVSDNLLGPR